MPKPTDARCDRALQEIAKGKSKALSLLYQEYGKMILAVAYRLVGNPQDAEDVLQDVMVQIVRGASRYRAGSNPRAWVMAITRNRAMDYLRSRTVTEDTDVADYHEAIVAPEGAGRDLYVKDALNTLPREDALLVHLKIYVGLTHSEIGGILGITEAACRKRYERALEKLKPYFEA